MDNLENTFRRKSDSFFESIWKEFCLEAFPYAKNLVNLFQAFDNSDGLRPSREDELKVQLGDSLGQFASYDRAWNGYCALKREYRNIDISRTSANEPQGTRNGLDGQVDDDGISTLRMRLRNRDAFLAKMSDVKARVDRGETTVSTLSSYAQDGDEGSGLNRVNTSARRREDPIPALQPSERRALLQSNTSYDAEGQPGPRPATSLGAACRSQRPLPYSTMSTIANAAGAGQRGARPATSAASLQQQRQCGVLAGGAGPSDSCLTASLDPTSRHEQIRGTSTNANANGAGQTGLHLAPRPRPLQLSMPSIHGANGVSISLPVLPIIVNAFTLSGLFQRKRNVTEMEGPVATQGFPKRDIPGMRSE
ncbi:hypothetical protein V5O48_016523 [Marasmius crinis-equi]|uniref:Uncharacterized protein n=1 Tax=Marasmius crinis-equi TaxID=585013 RepID=A0ABR3ERH5_9AGAR